METVALTFRYTQEEYVRAEKQQLLASKIITKTSVIIIPLCVLFTIACGMLVSWSALTIFGLVISVAALLILCILSFYMPIYQFKQTEKYHEDYNLTFSKEGIEFKTSSIRSSLSWSVYSACWESNAFYFLIQAPRVYAMIPKRAFRNLEEQERFEEIVTSGLHCKKRRI